MTGERRIAASKTRFTRCAALIICVSWSAPRSTGQVWALGMSCLLLDTKDAVDEAKAPGRDQLTAKALSELHAATAK